MRHPDRPASERSVIRLTLFLGFALIFLLWAATGYDFIRHVGEMQARTVRINDWFLETELLLDEVRTGVLLASVNVRDGLLDMRAPSDEFYRHEVEQARATVELALARYQPWVHSQAEHDDFDDLRRKVEGLWAATGPILALDEVGRTREATEALRLQLGPRREAIHRISARIERLNHGAAEDQRREIDSAYRSMERRVWALGGIALALSCLVALIITRYADRMEHQVRREMARNVESVHALQRLSDRLVRAEEEERRTISRELHDDVGQSLTVLKMELSRLAPSHRPTSESLSTLRETVDHVLNNVRSLSRLLHPMVLEDLGLPTALDWFLKDFGKRTGLKTDLLHTGFDERLAPGIETCLYRIVQEATQNVARHARACTCRVTLQRDAGRVLLVVQDDGRGFETAGAEQPAGVPRGLGLVSIRERVTGFGGALHIESRPGHGTRLAIELPSRLPGDDVDLRLSAAS